MPTLADRELQAEVPMRGDNLAGSFTPSEAKSNDLLDHRMRGNDSSGLLGRECQGKLGRNKHETNRRRGQRVGNIKNVTRGLLPKVINIDGLVDSRILPSQLGKRRFKEGFGERDGPRASRKNVAKGLNHARATAQIPEVSEVHYASEDRARGRSEGNKERWH